MAAKFYVIWKGLKTGVFDNWNECSRNIQGVEGALYKSFPTKEAAVQAFANGAGKYIGHSQQTKQTSIPTSIVVPSICVDAACSGNPGIMEYRGVETSTKREIFRVGPFPDATNNIGEFLALVHGLSYLKKLGYHTMPIYSDSVTAMAWVRNKKAKTELARTPRNTEVFDLIARAEKNLHENKYSNPIFKWDTPVLGEIPADFGRK